MAAGNGTRLRPLTLLIPKPLVPVAGRGTLLRLLDSLPSSVDRLIIVVGYLADKIKEAVGSEYAGRPVVYVTQSALNGTGGALRSAQPAIVSRRFFVLNGDDLYSKQDLETLAGLERGALVYPKTMDRPGEGWRIENGFLQSLEPVAVGSSAYLNINAFVMGHEWFETTPVPVPTKPDEWSLPHALEQVFGRHKYRAFETKFWYPCGTIDEIRRAEEGLRQASQV